MVFLREFTPKKDLLPEDLSQSEIFSIYYHSIFDYPLTFSELIKWTPKDTPEINTRVNYKNGYYFIEGKEALTYKRSIRKRVSQDKIKIAKKAARIIGLIPSVKMVGLTGSLAMNNAKKESDIDLFIITRAGGLWATRLTVYLILKILGFPVRSHNNLNQRDKLCLNIWLDESDLSWSKKDRNFYTAHEILQIVPLVNKRGAYENFISVNSWTLNYWPNAAEIRHNNNSFIYSKHNKLNILESIAFRLQYSYMKPRITREVATPTRGIFHPNDLSIRIVNKYT